MNKQIRKEIADTLGGLQSLSIIIIRNKNIFINKIEMNVNKKNQILKNANFQNYTFVRFLLTTYYK